MIRLLVHVEGQSEESFVNEVLGPHLYHHGVSAVARLLGHARQRERRGGIKGWGTVRDEIVCNLREDRDSVATTMVDYYGLPATGRKAWPQRKEASARQFTERAKCVENAMAEDIRDFMGPGFHDGRFVPFLMMYEFEALLFSDCKQFSAAIGQSHLANPLQEIRDGFSSPEEINDSPTGAPSKRIVKLVSRYQKLLMGIQGAKAIGLPNIRSECRHFSCWLEQLESLK